MKHLLYAAFFLATLTSCSFFSSKSEKPDYSENRARMEVEAQQMLSTARAQLAGSQCSQAKATIEQMRKDCYLALDARKAGILLMDSVDLQLARNELALVDSLLRAKTDSVSQADFDEACRKVQFYERKIQYDKSK